MSHRINPTHGEKSPDPTFTLTPPKESSVSWGDLRKSDEDQLQEAAKKTTEVKRRLNSLGDELGITSKPRNQFILPQLQLSPEPLQKKLSSENNEEVHQVRLRTPSRDRIKIARISSHADLKASLQDLSKTEGKDPIRRTSDRPNTRNKETTDALLPRKKGDRADGSKSDRGGRPLSEDKPLRIIIIPLSSFVRQLDKQIPIVSYKEWMKNVKASIREKVLHIDFSMKVKEKTIQGIVDRLLDCSSILTRIDIVRVQLFGVNHHNYLRKFPKNSTPLQFWKNYECLKNESPDKWRDFYEIMGGHEAAKILGKAVESKGKAMREKIEAKLDLVHGVEIKMRNLTKTSFSFLEDFDVKNPHVVSIPIYLLDFREFEETFRAFYSDGPFPSDSIRINGKNLNLPNYNYLEISSQDRPNHFLTWLLSEMETRMHLSSQYSKKEQIQLFAEEWREGTNSLKQTIANHFQQEFSAPYKQDEFLRKLNHCFEKLQQVNEAASFVKQMKPHLIFICSYLSHHEGFNCSDWRWVASDLTRLCERVHLFEHKNKKIPLLAVMKSMCYASYSTAELFMRKDLCPDLFNKECPYSLVLDHKQLTRYDIWGGEGALEKLSLKPKSFQSLMRGVKGTLEKASLKPFAFETTHIKAFKILCEGKVKASIELHWTPRGELGTIKYDSRIEIAKFEFDSECPYAERKVISGLFNLDIPKSSWGESLKLESINDFLMGPEKPS